MRTSVLAVCLLVGLGSASADEALMISSGGKTQMHFMNNGQRVSNNLKPPKYTAFCASMKGRLGMITLAPSTNKISATWRLVSPFRNLHHNQWAPFYKDSVVTPYRGKDEPVYMQWAPDGLKFLIRMNRKIMIHHAGSGRLLTITDIGDASGANMQWGQDSKHLVYYHPNSMIYYLVSLPERGTISWAALGRRNSTKIYQCTPQNADVDRFIFSPDGRQVAYIRPHKTGFEVWAGTINRPGRIDFLERQRSGSWNQQRTLHTVKKVIPRFMALGWSQDSQRFYYYAERVEGHELRDNGRNKTLKEKMSVRDIRAYDVRAAKALKIMQSNWSPSGYHGQFRQPIVCEKGRYLIFWGVNNSGFHTLKTVSKSIVYQSPEKIHLALVDLQAKSAKSIAQSRLEDLPFAAFIKTQNQDDNVPSTVRDEPVAPPAAFSLQIQNDLKAATFMSTRTIRIPFKGTVANLASMRKNYHLIATFQRNAVKVKDSDGKFAEGGFVANYMNLNDRTLKVNGNSFSGTLHVPLNDLDYVNTKPYKIEIHLALRQSKKVLVRARPKSLTVPAAFAQSIWFGDTDVRMAANGTIPIVKASCRAFMSHYDDEDVQVQLIIRTAEGKQIAADDATYRLADGLAGQSSTVRPTKEKRFQRVQFSIPANKLKFPLGQRVMVQFRGVYKGKAIGESRPSFVLIPALALPDF